MRKARPQWAVSGIVEAPVEQVWEALIEINTVLPETEKQTILREGIPQQVTLVVGQPSQGRIQIEIDKLAHSLTMQGEWWYRGTHQVIARGQTSEVIYSVYNIAPGITWWLAAFMQRRLENRMKSSLQQLLTGIRQHLGVG